MRRVVVTGIGAVTPLGNTAEEFMKNVLAGKNGIAPIKRFDASETGITVAAEVKDFDPTLYMEKKRSKTYGYVFCIRNCCCHSSNGR
jgi:3-oxoacyl-[acyl-carrier-protein] synthase II